MSTDTQLSSDALLLILETVNKQAAQIKRLEAIVAGDAATALDGGSRHGGAQLARLQASVAALQQQQQQQQQAQAACGRQELQDRLAQLEGRVHQLEAQGQQLQQQLGSPAPSRSVLTGQHRAASTTQVPILPSAPSAAYGAGHAAMGGGRSMAVRLQQLEHQVECLAGSAATAEDKLQTATTAVQALDSKLGRQLQNIRTDVQQALTVTSGSLKAELEAAAASRDHASARHLKQQLEGLSAAFDTRLSECQRSVVGSLMTEYDRRMAAAQEAADGRLAALRSQLDRLEEEKADVTLVTQYTGQVADVFEQLATTVADSTQASIAQLVSQQQELRGCMTSLSASKADGSSLLQHQQDCQQQLMDLQQTVVAAHSVAGEAAAMAKAAAEPVECLRLQLAETQGSVAALQAQTAGLEASAQSSSSEQQAHAHALQRLASSHQILQQQLMALGNHVDPAAAAQLAAAAAGDESALCYQPLGDTAQLASTSMSLLVNPVFEAAGGASQGEGACAADSWLTGSYLQRVGGGASSTGGGLAGVAAGAPSMSHDGCHPQHAGAASGATEHSAHGSAAAAATAGGRPAGTGAVLRHLPVAVRLLRLETTVRELAAALIQRAPAGDVATLQAQLEALAHRVAANAAELHGVSGAAMRSLEEHTASLAATTAALGSSVGDAEAAAASAASAASRAAVQPLQQQVAALAGELDGLRARLQAAGSDLQQLRDWRLSSSNQAEQLQQQVQQAHSQLAAELSRRQQDMQAALQQHSRDAASDALKQLLAEQEGAGVGPASSRLSALEAQLRVVAGEVDRVQEQATLAARVQDKHHDMVAALEAALQAQGSKHVAVLQQLRRELKEALAKAAQVQGSRASALEASLKAQGEALAELAASVAELPSAGGVLEGAVKAAMPAVEELLAQHKQQEEGRWEVWLGEFARAMEQRPTASQVQQQLAAARQLAEAGARGDAAARLQRMAAALEAGLRGELHGLQQQLAALAARTGVLEQGTGIGGAEAEGPGGGGGSEGGGRAVEGHLPRLQGGASGSRGSAPPPAAASSNSGGGDGSSGSRRQLRAEQVLPPARQQAAGAATHGKAGSASHVAAAAALPAPGQHVGARAASGQSTLPFAADAHTAVGAGTQHEHSAESSASVSASGSVSASASAAGASSVAARDEDNGGEGGATSSQATVAGSTTPSGSAASSSSCCQPGSPPRRRAAAARPATPPAEGGPAAGSGAVQQRGTSASAAAAPQAPSPRRAHAAAPGSPTLTASQDIVGLTAGGPPAAAERPRPDAQDPDAAAAAAAEAAEAAASPPPAQGRLQPADSDCTAELEQLLALQQQVQQCLVDNGCVALGRRSSKPGGARHGSRRHSSRRHVSRDGTAAGTAVVQPSRLAAVTSATADDALPERASGPAAQAAGGGAAAAAADGPARAEVGARQPVQEQQRGAHGAARCQHQQQQQEQEQEQDGAAAQWQPQEQQEQGQDMQQLMNLQQQLLQCLEQHGCRFNQREAPQQQQPQPEPEQLSLLQQLLAPEASDGGDEAQDPQHQQQQQQRHGPGSGELEQLLALQQQMQLALSQHGFQ